LETIENYWKPRENTRRQWKHEKTREDNGNTGYTGKHWKTIETLDTLDTLDTLENTGKQWKHWTTLENTGKHWMYSQAFGGKRGDDGGGTDHDAVVGTHSMQQQAHVQIY